MMRGLIVCILIFGLFGTKQLAAQSVGIGTLAPNENAALHVVSPTNSQGLLIPQLSTTQRQAIPAQSPRDNGLLVFDVTEQAFYFWKDGSWNSFAEGANQTLVYNPVTMQLSLNQGGNVDLSPLQQNASQVLISAITGITSSNVQEALAELKTMISDAGEDNQQLTLTGSTLTLEDGGAPIDLSSLLFTGDFADLTNIPVNLDLDASDDLVTGDNISALINDAGYQRSSDDNDTDPSNEAITDFRITATHLEIEENGSLAGSIPLSGLPSSPDDQQLNLAGNILSLEDGGTPIDLSTILFSGDFADLTNVPVNLDLDASDDLVTGDNISDLNNDAGYQLSSDDGDIDATNELIDSFSLTGDNLSLTENGSLVNTIDLSPYRDNTDNQQLTLASDMLTLENGGPDVDLSPYLDNTDNQTLSFNSLLNTLTISGGNTISLASLAISIGDDNQSVTQFNLNGTFNNLLNFTLENDAGGTRTVNLHDLNFDAGSDLTGTLGNAELKDGSVDSNTIQDGTILSTDIQDNTITNNDIADNTITNSKILSLSPSRLEQSGAGNGQVLKWDGANWIPADDQTGSGGMPGTKTSYYSVDPADFSIMHEDNKDLDKNLRLIFSSNNQFVTVVEGNKASYLIAPLHLPDGADLTGIEIYYWDDDPNNIDVRLVRKSFSGPNENIAAWTSSGSSASIQNTSVSSLNNSLVDNSTYTYRLIANLDTGGGKNDSPDDADMRIYAVKIAYTEPGNLISGPGNYQTAYVSDSAPPVSERYPGFLWVDSSSERIRVWNGSGWDTVANNDN